MIYFSYIYFLILCEKYYMKRRNYIHLIESNFLHNHYYVYINHGRIAYKSVTMLSLQPSCVKSNCQGDGDAPGRNSRGTSSPFQFPFSFLSLCSPILFILALPQFSQKRQTSPQPAP